MPEKTDKPSINQTAAGDENIQLSGSGHVVVISQAFLQKNDRRSLREWWHGILSDYGRYSCYAIFLVLPSDKEAIRYLTNFGRELDLISGENCLVITLSKTDFRRSSFDDKLQSGKKKAANFIEYLWNAAVKEHITIGYSVQVAKFFNISFEQFPCLVIFQDIRNPNHTVIVLKDLTAEDIMEKMRVTFSIVQNAVAVKKNPLDALQTYRTHETLLRKGNSIVSELHSIAGKTFEAAIDSWIKASIK